MKPIKIPPIAERAQLLQTPNEQLVEIVLRQQEVIEQLVEEVERLKNNGNSDSQSSSKPLSSDIDKRSGREREAECETSTDKRKPGGQPGHEGKARKGFGRVDRYGVVRPQQCPECGGVRFAEEPVQVRRFVVAELVELVIEVVEYQQQCCECSSCGAVVWGVLPAGVVGEQSLGARLQAMLVWLCDYGHLSYEKQPAILLSVIQTCRAQGRSAFEFFQQALLSIADSNAQPMPSLIPVTTT